MFVFMSMAATTAASMASMASATSLISTGTRAPETLAPSDIEQSTLPFNRAEGRENALDVARLWLMSEELLCVLVWRRFVLGVRYRLGAAAKTFRGYRLLYNMMGGF
jgi:hypothetical protein